MLRVLCEVTHLFYKYSLQEKGLEYSGSCPSLVASKRHDEKHNSSDATLVKWFMNKGEPNICQAC